MWPKAWRGNREGRAMDKHEEARQRARPSRRLRSPPDTKGTGEEVVKSTSPSDSLIRRHARDVTGIHVLNP